MVSINIRRLLPISISCSNCSLTIDLPVEPESKQNSHIPPLVIIIVAILGGCFLLVSYYAIIVKYCSNWNRSRRPQVVNEQNLDAHEDFLDENHGPVVDHPIWYITTVGLEQGVIDSIAVFKYKKGDGLVEGTDCSVCLSEFQDDENLRLLPKCSHTFHISCIDTWLRSHTNCPSCRAPIVSSPVLPASTAVVGNSGVREEAQVENSASDGGVGSELNREGGVSDLSLGVQGERVEVERSRGIDVQKKDLPAPFKMSKFRVFSDLSDNHWVGEEEDRYLQAEAEKHMDEMNLLYGIGDETPVVRVNDDVVRFCPEISDEIYRYQRSIGLPLHPDYIKTTQSIVPSHLRITIKDRSDLISFMINLAQKYQLKEDTLHLCIINIDRFLALTPVLKKDLFPIGIVSMLTACKFEEVQTLSVFELCRTTGNLGNMKEVVELESVFLRCLNYQIGFPTVLTFLRFFSRYQSDREDIEVENLSLYLAELSLSVYDCLNFSRGVVAAAVMYLTNLKLRPETEPWNYGMEERTGYTVGMIGRCVRVIHEAQTIVGGKNETKAKFKESRFASVSNLKPPRLLKDFW